MLSYGTHRGVRSVARNTGKRCKQRVVRKATHPLLAPPLSHHPQQPRFCNVCVVCACCADEKSSAIKSEELKALDAKLGGVLADIVSLHAFKGAAVRRVSRDWCWGLRD